MCWCVFFRHSFFDVFWWSGWKGKDQGTTRKLTETVGRPPNDHGTYPQIMIVTLYILVGGFTQWSFAAPIYTYITYTKYDVYHVGNLTHVHHVGKLTPHPHLTKNLFIQSEIRATEGETTLDHLISLKSANTQRRNELVTVGVLQFILALNGPLLYILVAGNRSVMKRFELIPPLAPNCSLKSKHQQAN